jgi:DivIVA domain-containing protein
MGGRMPLTPEEIRAQKFTMNLRGYEKEQVDSFLLQIAADYEAALSAIASAADPYGALGHEVSSVLRSAKESAEKLRREAEDESKAVRQEATDEALEMRRQAAEEAAATLEGAREKAISLSTEAERQARNAENEITSARQRALDESVEIRRQAAEEAAATLDAATDKAERLSREAQRHAQEMRAATQKQCDEMLHSASNRFDTLKALEHELHTRVEAIDKALARLRAELQTGDGAAAPSQHEERAEDVMSVVDLSGSEEPANSGSASE